MIKLSYSEILEEFGAPNCTLWRTLNAIFPPLKCSSLKDLWDITGVSKTTKKIVREVIAKKVVNKKRGNKTYLLKDEEAYILATSEIDGAHGPPRDTEILTNEIQQVLHDVGKRKISNGTEAKFSQRYSCRFIQHVNREEEKAEGKKRKTRIGMIKFRA